MTERVAVGIGINVNRYVRGEYSWDADAVHGYPRLHRFEHRGVAVAEYSAYTGDLHTLSLDRPNGGCVKFVWDDWNTGVVVRPMNASGRYHGLYIRFEGVRMFRGSYINSLEHGLNCTPWWSEHSACYWRGVKLGPVEYEARLPKPFFLQHSLRISPAVSQQICRFV